jgi:hypothetical protein
MTSFRKLDDSDTLANRQPITGPFEALETLQTLRPAALEMERRPSRKSSVDVLHYRPAHSDYAAFLAKPGTATLFVAEKGAAILQAIRDAVASPDGQDSWIAHRLAAQFRQREMIPLDEAVRFLVEQPVFASLRYCGKTLASSLLKADGLDATVIPMAYNGGEIESETFQLVEHYQEGTEHGLEAVIVVHSPALSAAERVALQAVPPDQREWNIGQPSMCYAITAVTVFIVVYGATYACPFPQEESPEALGISDEEIKAIGPQATARKLLEIRRRALESP